MLLSDILKKYEVVKIIPERDHNPSIWNKKNGYFFIRENVIQLTCKKSISNDLINDIDECLKENNISIKNIEKKRIK